MVVPGRRKSIAFFISLGAVLIVVIVLLYIGNVLLHPGVPESFFFLGILLLGDDHCRRSFKHHISLVREIRRNERQDAFINAVTHELKTPVTSIRLYLQTLQTREVDESDSARNSTGLMLEDSDRLMSTIEQVLRTGRMGAASRKLNLARIDLDNVVEESLARARVIHHLGQEALRYHPHTPVTIQGDPDEVRAAVSNLIDNAIKYSGSNVNVTVETGMAEGKFVTLRVKDQGLGIPKMELKQIFKRFYRVSGPNATRVKGTGLGLYIVRSVAKRHRGRVWAESEGPGRGSTFVLQLPLAP